MVENKDGVRNQQCYHLLSTWGNANSEAVGLTAGFLLVEESGPGSAFLSQHAVCCLQRHRGFCLKQQHKTDASFIGLTLISVEQNHVGTSRSISHLPNKLSIWYSTPLQFPGSEAAVLLLLMQRYQWGFPFAWHVKCLGSGVCHNFYRLKCNCVHSLHTLPQESP